MPEKQRWYYSVDASTVLEITDRVRLPSPGGDGQPASVGAHAEEGSGESVTIEVDDPAGDLIMLLHRRVYSTSDAAAAGKQVIGNWFIQNLDVVRMDPWSGTSRRWLVQMVDENSLLERRIFVGATSDRPAETDIARILWMLGETELNTLSPDVTYIDQTGPKDLDAADYTQQKPKAVLEHCKKASGKNYWIKYEEAAAVGGAIVSSSVAAASVITTTSAHGLVSGQQVVIAGHSGSTPAINGTHTVTVTGASTFTIPVNVTVGGTGGTTSTVGRYVLCYFDAATSTLYPSTIALSNLASEIDSSTVFAISDDTKLNRSGDRSPASGMVETYTGGYVYEQDTDVGDTYVYRDVSSSSVNVKTAAKATAIVVRELAEFATPDDEVETEFYPDWDQVNDAMHGMWLPFRATHFPNYTSEATLPGYANTTNMRIMRRQVRVRENGGMPAVRLWMTPMGTPVEPFAVLYRAQTDDDYPAYVAAGIYPIAWRCSGDRGIADCVAYPDEPTVGPLAPTAGFISDPLDPPSTGPIGNYLGWTFSGAGTIDLHGTFIAYTAANGITCTVEILVDGIVAVTATGVTSGGSGCTIEFTQAGITVDVGSVLTGRFYYSNPALAIYLDTPLGSPTDAELRITGGSLVA